MNVGADTCLLTDYGEEGAVRVLHHESSTGVGLVQAAADRGVSILRAQTPPGVWAQYDPATNTVTLDSRLDAYSAWERGAILAHELSLALEYTSPLPGTWQGCPQASEDSYRDEDAVWRQLIAPASPPSLQQNSVQSALADISGTIATDPEKFAQELSTRYAGDCP